MGAGHRPRDHCSTLERRVKPRQVHHKLDGLKRASRLISLKPINLTEKAESGKPIPNPAL